MTKDLDTYSDLVIKDGDIRNPLTILNRQQINDDVSFLLKFLDQGYSGKNFLPDGQFKKLVLELEEIKKSEALSPIELCNKIEKSILKINDNHFWASLRTGKCGVPRFDYAKAVYLGKNLNQDLNTPWLHKEIKINKKAVSVFSFSYFPKWESQLWDGFGVLLKKSVQSSHAIILDLRSNGGGSQGPTREIAKLLYGQEPMEIFDGGAEVQTAEAKAMLYNSLKLEILSQKQSGKNAEEFQLKALAKGLEDFKSASRNPPALREVVYSGDVEDRKLNSELFYKHPILVLVDEFCASSCEALLLYLRSHPNAKFVGTHSGGFLQFGELGSVLLKNSQIVADIPTKHFRLKGGFNYEKIGIKADVQISFRDAYKYAVNLLEKRL